MKRLVTVMSIILTIILNTSCSKSDSKPSIATKTSVTAISPNSGTSGMSVIITGSNFSNTNNIVTFQNGIAATVTLATPTSLTVTVPTGGSTGSISVNGVAGPVFTYTAGSDPNVYIAGGGNTGSLTDKATYWNAGVANILPDGTQAYGIFVSGSDIYVAGTKGNAGVLNARYWKNGTAIPLDLTNKSNKSEAKAITLSGSDVYVAGYEDVIAKYWKNGVATSLNTTSGNTAYGTSICISGNDVYVGGYEYSGGTTAVYWKNGTEVNFTNGKNVSQTNSILFYSNDIYAAGFEYSNDGAHRIAKYWKNGNAVALSDSTHDAEILSFVISGLDVYAAGYDNGVAQYWKNGKAVKLTTTTGSYATAIVVSVSDVYVAGHDSNGPKYWKNGSVVNLPNISGSELATAIFLK